MRKVFLKNLGLAVALGALCLSPSFAQEQKKESEEKPPKEVLERKMAAEHSASIYRVEYAVRELEKGKLTNTRHYTLMVQAADELSRRNSVGFRVGSRVPIATEKDKFQYFDLGVNIDCTLKEEEGHVLVLTVLEINSVAASKLADTPTTPVVRSLRFNDTTKAMPGKRTLVGSIDDVTEDRSYDIEVTATIAD